MCEEFENEKKKEQNFFDLPERDLNPRFSVIFPPMIWIIKESEEPEIKPKQASKRDRTLSKVQIPSSKTTEWKHFWAQNYSLLQTNSQVLLVAATYEMFCWYVYFGKINQEWQKKVHHLGLNKINAHNLETILIRSIWWWWMLWSTFDTHLFSPFVPLCLTCLLCNNKFNLLFHSLFNLFRVT